MIIISGIQIFTRRRSAAPPFRGATVPRRARPGCKKGLQRHIEYLWGNLVVGSGAVGAGNSFWAFFTSCKAPARSAGNFWAFCTGYRGSARRGAP